MESMECAGGPRKTAEVTLIDKCNQIIENVAMDKDYDTFNHELTLLNERLQEERASDNAKISIYRAIAPAYFYGKKYQATMHYARKALNLIETQPNKEMYASTVDEMVSCFGKAETDACMLANCRDGSKPSKMSPEEALAISGLKSAFMIVPEAAAG